MLINALRALVNMILLLITHQKFNNPIITDRQFDGFETKLFKAEFEVFNRKSKTISSNIVNELRLEIDFVYEPSHWSTSSTKLKLYIYIYYETKLAKYINNFQINK